ncbi:RadC family protein [Thiohalobacter thiocyanaticus]|uniref:JAB domain-containing protein n=1 Tax=Thiohalobacter thiocyanaticus TaxID=585455 RepID=A0A426QKA5_9GAMM|nr:DNA repair protein RadC [Thiohalobacter thiocyanaticus]RRQ22170.1 JAB domain-containing protein [Thiohalobacter thiocyanaticus]
MTIRDWPAQERPREKLLRQGAASLSDAELLAIFLRTGVPGRDAVALARDLLHDHGGLRGLLALDARSLDTAPGLGPAKYVQLQAALEMARRHYLDRLRRGSVLSNPDDTRRYLHARLSHHPHEVFACLFLDNRHAVIECEELFRGTLNSAAVHPREVVKAALAHNAAAVILAHNHPSGVAEPSQADQLLTRRLKEALALVEIRVLDHLVIGAGETVSLAERGLL